jgi:hypothetical protein
MAPGQVEVHTRTSALIAMLLIANAPAKIPSACPQAALERVRAKLQNADSAMFKSIAPMDAKGGGYCGWVNAKNSTGEYQGYSLFFASHNGPVIILPSAGKRAQPTGDFTRTCATDPRRPVR